MGRNVAEEKAGTPVAKEADLYSWAVRQAELLRKGRLAEIDAAAIAEEIDDVGEEEYYRLESALRVLMLHLLKWDHQPERRSRSWTLSIQEHRRRAQRQLLRTSRTMTATIWRVGGGLSYSSAQDGTHRP